MKKDILTKFMMEFGDQGATFLDTEDTAIMINTINARSNVTSFSEKPTLAPIYTRWYGGEFIVTSDLKRLKACEEDSWAGTPKELNEYINGFEYVGKGYIDDYGTAYVPLDKLADTNQLDSVLRYKMGYIREVDQVVLLEALGITLDSETKTLTYKADKFVYKPEELDPGAFLALPALLDVHGEEIFKALLQEEIKNNEERE